MTEINTAIWSELNQQQQQQLLQRPAASDDVKLSKIVTGIIDKVREQGDAALIDMALQFDKVELNSLVLDKTALNQLATQLDSSIIAAIDCAYDKIERFHRAQVQQDIKVTTGEGIECELRQRPLAKVGLYIPGGSAPLISTVLMLGIPAQIAGCGTKVLCTPPNKDPQGNVSIHPAIAYAALKCGIEQVYLSGGAQAIAAMAYGSETIPKVDKIFGPGNSFVTMAKQLVSNANSCVTIDMPAGPSEVLVIADQNANPAFIAADLLSQAEHGPDSQVVLVSNSNEVIEQSKQAVQQQLAELERKDIASASLAHALFILADSKDQAIEISNQYAPEHLIIQTDDAPAVVEQCDNASSIFVGAYSPESAGDYASGTNHVLPTYGYSRVLSSLSLADFCKRFTVQTLSKDGLASIGDAIIDLATAEGLQAHANAVAIRLSATSTSSNGGNS
jgi:histidinol dehydrogenase